MVVRPSELSLSDRAPAAVPDRIVPCEHAPARRSWTRQVRLCWLAADGGICERSQSVPALPMFEAAFSAFARGALIATSEGPVAVEDLLPGDRLCVAGSRETVQLLWVGTMTWLPRLPQGATRTPLIRLPAGTLGAGRPVGDLVLGAGARLLRRDAGGTPLLVPAPDFAEQMQAILITPPTALPLYHLVTEQHAVLCASGLEAESHHPGPNLARRMSSEMLALYLSLFPHIRRPDGFGALCLPRSDAASGVSTLSQAG